MPDPIEATAVLLTGTVWPLLLRVWRRLRAALPSLLVVALWFVFVYVLPLKILRASRRATRLELVQLLRPDQPHVPAAVEAFDRETEQVLLSASAPYFILGLATLFSIAHLILVKRRLRIAERNIQCLREVMRGVDGVSLR